jgi:tRNA threonylcarbamoyl adenosine modification protein YeaZ
VTLGISTSSPWASVAAFAPEGRLLWEAQEHAPQRASGACLAMLRRMLTDLDLRVEDFEVFAADMGPGSFTGVRVGVMLAKTLAWSNGRRVAGADAFDLIAPDRTVILPSKKGEFFVREPGTAPYRDAEIPAGAVGYGVGVEEAVPPSAARFGAILDRLTPVDPLAFAPAYLIEPSISIPKRAFRHA